MNRYRLACAALGAALTAAALAPTSATPASAFTTYHRIVMGQASDSAGAQYPGGTGAARISSDGQWLAFSRLTVNGSFVKSLVSGATTLVSLNDADQPANGPSTIQGISADGSVVAFATAATNMGQGAATTRDVYLRNLATGSTRRANLLPGTGTPVAVKPGESTLSDDGKVVAFTSAANHVYAWDAPIDQTQQVDVSTSETAGNSGSIQPSLSGNGRFVTFTTFASNLVSGDANFVSDILVRDRTLGTTERVSLSDTEVAPNDASNQSSVSEDGRYVAFASVGTNLVSGDTNSGQDVFLRDTVAGSTKRISVKPGGGQANGDSGRPDIAPAGAYVAFESTADDMSSNAPNAKADVFVRDISGNLTEQWGADGWTPSNQGASAPSLAANGTVAATSPSTNLIAGDTNAAPDAYVEGYRPLGPFAEFGPLVETLHADFGVSPATNAAVQADLENGRLTTGRLIVGLAHTPSWAQHREPVARLYQAFFHRQPDLNGLTYWVTKRAAGTKLGVIAASFAGSNEFKTAYGTVDSTTFVTLVYANVLQRKPDPAGLDHWVTKMAGGMSRGDVMVAFSESSEGKRFLAPEVDATLMGLAMLKGSPSKALWKQVADTSRDRHMSEAGALIYLSSGEFVQVVVK